MDILSESSKASGISTISRYKIQSIQPLILPDVDVVALDDSVGEVGREPRDDDRAGRAHRRLHAAGRAGNCKQEENGWSEITFGAPLRIQDSEIFFKAYNLLYT